MSLSNVLVLTFLVLFPLWDRWELRRLKQGAAGARTGFYLRTTVGLWLVTVIVLQILTLATCLAAPPVSLDFVNARTLAISTQIVCALALIVLILPVFLLWRAKEKRQRALAALDAVAYFLPQSVNERVLFGLVSVTAGICEEIIFRGFLTRYFLDQPWALPLWASLVLASLLFGAAHAGHGWTGILRTGLLGWFLALLYVGTGSLILPIAIHACIDLRMLAFAMMRNPRAIDGPQSEGAVPGAG